MLNLNDEVEKNLTLDPENWDAVRALGHRMIDDVMDLLQNIANEPVWKPIANDAKSFYEEKLPVEPQNIDEVYQEFKKYIFQYPKGSIHPAFFAWVQGTGTPMGVLADLLASAMNSNVSRGEHSASYIDKQIVSWCKQMLGYPESASGILLSGGSMANITALTVARNHQLEGVRNKGLNYFGKQMILYCSNETHSCIQKAVEILGLGTNAMRKIPVNENYQINTEKLIEAIEKDLADDLFPFCIVGNAGTVNTGAIDPMDELLEISRKYKLWFHVDGAYGALAKLDPDYSAALKGIEQADSVAFDMHKWLYMPYEIGCTLIKNSEAHRKAFAIAPDYLTQEKRGVASGPDSNYNYGFELSRGFKALKVWMSLKEHGISKYSQQIHQNNLQAKYLEQLVNKNESLELLAPVSLSIVCYRFVKPGLTETELDELNREIIIRLQEEGIATASSTILKGKFAIRVCIVNHRTTKSVLDIMIKETVRIGRNIAEKK